jgi:LacI family gluconate utilization system Gnt-I transcriptional repressor
MPNHVIHKQPPKDNKSTAVTKEDVARAAGVSHITVSRVINTPDKVAPTTRKKVESFIAKMGYIPNLLAGGLASKRTRIIAAIVPTIGHSIFAETIRGLSEQLASQGYQLLLGQSNYSETEETALIEAFIGRRVDGIVLTGTQHTARARQRLKAAAIPVVETWDLSDKPIDMLVGFSNYDAGFAMGEHLKQQGYRHIAFVGGEDPRGVARLAGLTAALKKSRIKTPVHIAVQLGTFLQRGRQSMIEILDNHPQTDAVFFSNDVLAAGALMECQKRKRRVPEDIALCGFADLEIAREITPAITTVKIDSFHIGHTAAQMLLATLNNRPVPEVICDLGFTVIPRQST